MDETDVDEMLSIRPPNGEMLVLIRSDGSIEYGPDYDPDAAAKILWEAVAQNGLFAWQSMARAAGWMPPPVPTS